MKYKITVLNKNYNQTFIGVKFENGVGFTNDDKTARYLSETFKYKVEKIEEEKEELFICPNCKKEYKTENGLNNHLKKKCKAGDK